MHVSFSVFSVCSNLIKIRHTWGKSGNEDVSLSSLPRFTRLKNNWCHWWTSNMWCTLQEYDVEDSICSFSHHLTTLLLNWFKGKFSQVINTQSETNLGGRKSKVRTSDDTWKSSSTYLNMETTQIFFANSQLPFIWWCQFYLLRYAPRRSGIPSQIMHA